MQTYILVTGRLTRQVLVSIQFYRSLVSTTKGCFWQFKPIRTSQTLPRWRSTESLRSYFVCSFLSFYYFQITVLPSTKNAKKNDYLKSVPVSSFRPRLGLVQTCVSGRRPVKCYSKRDETYGCEAKYNNLKLSNENSLSRKEKR